MEFDEIVLKEKENRLSISRVPKITKEEFVNFAKEEFCDDFGMTLKYVWDGFKMWKLFYENIDMKIDKALFILENSNESEVKVKREKLKMLSGGEKNAK